MIFTLCGTSDARELAVRMQQSGYKLLASVVTDNAAKSLEEAEIPVRIGRLTFEDMVKLFRDIDCKVVVDASHPFAEDAHKNAMRAAQEANLPYIRFERASLVYNDHPKLTIVSSYEEAALMAKERKGSIMLTTGSKTLPIFAKHLLQDPEIRLVARMLPRKDNMELCEQLGVEQKNIIALQGPFAPEMNEALYRQFGTTVMITKESGKIGAVDEKVNTALAMDIDVLLISRPELEFGNVYTDNDGVLNKLQEIL
ncbi:precorrin-6A reductase [Paenibacillus baekrokdamisoli]|uniref:Precorrin-6A reductase n=1 Tax=Paenibacillus baekrokdamisoli TaxID=1712516 RepID=A0A3G9IQ34_9BACL|nr:precorrin-6A reductase [Paenibacillus baekrokdamisoli]MBB3072426.1 precorrin-6A/cobalt-precorrin-6A reductase [Paenibacillus baekrokdamisoli]BBH20486.1 precorrin-6A reductase [Paenibacillus baekrokdamisoli]